MLLPYNEKGFSLVYVMEHLGNHIGTVEYVETVFFVWNLTHHLRVMQARISDDREGWDVRLYIVEFMKFNAAFAMMGSRPPIDRKAQGYR